jgi:hypothetical protein
MAHCVLGQSPSSAIPAEEAHFTQEQLQEYYRVYENGDVRYLRTLFEAYLSGAPGRDEEFKANLSSCPENPVLMAAHS